MMNGCEICRPFHDSINFVLLLRALANNVSLLCGQKIDVYNFGVQQPTLINPLGTFAVTPSDKEQ